MYKLLYQELQSSGEWEWVSKEFDYFCDLKAVTEKVNSSLWTRHLLVQVDEKTILRLKW